ncbi:MAG: hypothetical protein H0T42_03695 [Deltaproteobacteria bacterium]|nr:hypothetical protein [Deltaproteobacteria bacterium]
MLLSAVLVALAGTATPVLADNHADLAFEVGEYNHDKRSVRIIEKLVTLKLPEKCWPKLLDKKTSGLGSIAGKSRTISAIAKALTEEDWGAIESQSANDKATNQKLALEKVEAFASKFHVTLNLEGDDCVATGNAMWLKYLGTTLFALEKYPPKSGKAFVTINVTAKAKGAKTEISKDGTKFTITAGRDVEKSGWPKDIENPIMRVSSKQ